MPSLSETLWNYLQPRPGSATDGLRNQLASLLTGWSSKTSTPGTPKHNANVWLEEAARNLDSAIGGPERNRLRAVGPHDPTLDAQDRESLNQKMLNFVLNLGPQATVWHGSPHDILPKPGGKYPEFDMSKIGTGEGAQAYGHGIYTAESPQVAGEYARTLANVGSDRYATAHLNAQNQVQRFGNDPEYAAEIIKDTMNNFEKSDPSYKKLQDTLEMITSGKYRQPLQNAGSLYKVDIPDEAIPRMLDWDRPLSQQSPEVQRALSNTKNKQLRAMIDYANVPYSEMAGGEAKTMGEAFRLLNLNLQGKSSADSAKASALLAKQGIPGIRYLDGGSRSAGQGTSNYVLFDDKLGRILEKNGVPTGQTPWTPEEWAAYLSGGGK